MPILEVAPRSYIAACAEIGQHVAPELNDIASHLCAVLNQTGGMAGNDPAGRRWGSSYDKAASSVVAGLETLTTAGFRLAGLLQQSGFNFGSAELASQGGAYGAAADQTQYGLMSVGCVEPVPSAVGGDSGGPPGWGLVQKYVLGYAWPNGHQSSLHAAASAWRGASGSLAALPTAIEQAQYAISQLVSPYAQTAVDVCAAYSRHLSDVSGMCVSLADACDGLAHGLDTAHSKIEHKLAWATAESGAITVFTLGIGAVAGLSESRLAAAGAEIVEIVTELISQAGLLADTIDTVADRVEAIQTRLTPLTEAAAVATEVNNASKLPNLEQAANETANEELQLAAKAEQPAAGQTQQPAQGSGAQNSPGQSIPPKVERVLERIDEKGSPFPGYKGGGKYDNDGRHGEDILPLYESDGKPITYKKWDVTPKVKSAKRTDERIVTGSDGSAYYTTDHYLTFIKIRG